MLSTCVADYIDEDGRWNKPSFDHLLPQEVTDKITALAVDRLSSANDRLFWRETSNGHFSTKTTYSLVHSATTTVDMTTEPPWKIIWKLSLLERVRTFVWLLCSENLILGHGCTQSSLLPRLAVFAATTDWRITFTYSRIVQSPNIYGRR
ncbi:unnamed protein product [Linum trigynum]|uniref:Reverse transcriptase zinc-binding domain-containing protein n=1 Tax=Linum trigynum TaxID=586398 RepID=A0AAV2ESV9_9ROSI